MTSITGKELTKGMEKLAKKRGFDCEVLLLAMDYSTGEVHLQHLYDANEKQDYHIKAIKQLIDGLVIDKQ